MSKIDEWFESERKADALADAWTKFLAGHWQTDMPQAEGVYPTAHRDGEQGFTGTVYRNPQTGKFHAARIHHAWWWSEPVPSLPPTPPFPEAWTAPTKDEQAQPFRFGKGTEKKP
jgi:hypothetical protein